MENSDPNRLFKSLEKSGQLKAKVNSAAQSALRSWSGTHAATKKDFERVSARIEAAILNASNTSGINQLVRITVETLRKEEIGIFYDGREWGPAVVDFSNRLQAELLNNKKDI